MGRPVRTTVSPLRTDLTVARPRLGSTGRIAADGTGSDMVVWVAVVFVSSNLSLCLRLGAERRMDPFALFSHEVRWLRHFLPCSDGILDFKKF